MTSSITDFTGFPPEHDNRHNLRNVTDGRESLAFMLLLPEQGLAGFVYPTVLANGTALAKASLFGPALPEPIHETFQDAVPDEMDFYDWHHGGLKMAIRQPHQSLDLSWRGPRISLDYHYEALHPTYPFSSRKDAGSPPYYGDDRIEQHGVITGTLAVDGKTAPFKTFMHRDHSWGPRVWGLNQHHKWFHATTAGVSIHFFEMQSFGKTHLQGYLFRDGLMTQIERVEYDFTLGEGMMQTSMDTTVHDGIGRSVAVKCTTYAHIALDFDPLIVLNEAALNVTIGDETGVGWAEFCWNRNYLEYAQAKALRYAR